MVDRHWPCISAWLTRYLYLGMADRTFCGSAVVLYHLHHVHIILYHVRHLHIVLITLQALVSHSLRLYSGHSLLLPGPQVLDVPPGAQLLASSPTARMEMWSYGSHVLAFQFHPEMTCGVVLEKIFPSVQSRCDE
jgi:hypothetical protein